MVDARARACLLQGAPTVRLPAVSAELAARLAEARGASQTLRAAHALKMLERTVQR